MHVSDPACGCSEESSGLCSRRRGAVAAAVGRRVRGEPVAAARAAARARVAAAAQPLDQAAGECRASIVIRYRSE